MPRVPITIMGYQCARCGHEWLPRGDVQEPKVCPSCHSAWWDTPRPTSATTYEEFSNKVHRVLNEAGRPMTWTEVRTQAKLSQLFPNNQWVRRMEKDIQLIRNKDQKGIIMWSILSNEVQ